MNGSALNMSCTILSINSQEKLYSMILFPKHSQNNRSVVYMYESEPVYKSNNMDSIRFSNSLCFIESDAQLDIHI